MCIRDRVVCRWRRPRAVTIRSILNTTSASRKACLLYTSDAADDLTRVDLVGRRFFQAENGIRDLVRSRGLGDVYKRQGSLQMATATGRHNPFYTEYDQCIT